MLTINLTNFRFPQQTGFYRGKVRDDYYFKSDVSLTDTLSKVIEIEILGEIQLVGKFGLV